MKKTISLVLVLALGLATEVVNADFIFDSLANLGPVNSLYDDSGPSISTDGLSLYFASKRLGEFGIGNDDIWVVTRETPDEPWGEPVNLGRTVNSVAQDAAPRISVDGLSLYFCSRRFGGYGDLDLWVTTRVTTEDDWREPMNLGPMVNSQYHEDLCYISPDGLSLFFDSTRPGGQGGWDIWVTTRATKEDPWGEPLNLGPPVNSPFNDGEPSISTDGRILFFTSNRPGGCGRHDLWLAQWITADESWGTPVNLSSTVNCANDDYTPDISSDGSTLYFTSYCGFFQGYDLLQVSILPIVDFNGDGIVDAADMCIMVDHWGEDYSLCDIGPMPWGDGIVDVQDLIVLAEHLFEGIPPVELEEVNVDEEDNGSQVELEQGQILVITLESNPTTGYRWEVAEIQESILEQMGEAEFKPSETGEPPLVGAGGWEIFRFKAISAGQMTLKLVYRRSWEEGVEPINTFSIEVVVN